MYDPVTNAWANKANMNDGRIGAGVVLLGDGRVMAAGGKGYAQQQQTSCELYSVSSNTWTRTGSTNNAVNAATIVLDSSPSLTRVLRFGGVLTATEIYNSSSGTWSLSGSMLTTRTGFGATKLSNGNVFVAGGRSNASQVLSLTEEYNVSNGTWSSRPSMGVAREKFGLAALPTVGKLLAVGGRSAGGTIQTTAELYTP